MEFTLTRGKRPSETLQIGVDVTNDLLTGDASVSHTITAWDGVTDVSATCLTTPVLAGNVSKVNITAGVVGKTYRVQFIVTTVAGYVYEHDVVVPVNDYS
jgi:hypothetical protein